MLAQIRNVRTMVVPLLLCALVVTMTSCATQKDTAIVQDPDAHYESSMPWNKQERWETGGQFQAMTDRR
jgi:Spy/CpxP family protein refolding chaperone